MSWWAIGSAAVSIIGSVVSKQKGAKEVPVTPTVLGDEQKKALESNLANQSSIEAIVGRSNAFDQKEALGLMEQAMPGYGDLTGRLTGLAKDLSTNPYDLPPDVQKNLERLSAEKGIQTGRGGQAGDFSLLRDLGINSLEYGQNRISQAQGLTGLLASLAPRVNPASPMAFYVTPNTQAGITAQNNANAQATAQAGINSATAAGNANSSNLWSNILQGAVIGSQYGANKNTTTKNTTSSSVNGISPASAH